MTIQYATCGDIEVAYETFGSPADPTVLLVMGLATQMIGWPDGFCEQLAAEGFHVVRFDNRDVGLSTHVDDAAVYTLADMADDVAALILAIDVAPVHLVGVSMGGMIAQEVALRHPGLLSSLTSIMSTPAPHIGAATPEALGVLFAPPPTTEEEAGLRAVEVYSVIGSPGYPLDEPYLRDRGAESFRRANDPAGVMRQLTAIQISGDRTERLTSVSTPTLVIHGEDDPLIQLEGGVTTAKSIPGSRFVTFAGMGHDLPYDLWSDIIGAIAELAREAS